MRLQLVIIVNQEQDKYNMFMIFYLFRFSHGLIFNMLYKAVYEEGENGTNEQILSLTIFLLELALSYPQQNYSGKVNLNNHNLRLNPSYIHLAHSSYATSSFKIITNTMVYLYEGKIPRK